MNRSNRTRSRPALRRRWSARRGFTLLESLIAASVLGIIVIAVASAISASQKVSFEGQKRILAVIAADDLMMELITLPYEELRGKDGAAEGVGEMMTLDGDGYPEAFWAIGRRVSVTEAAIEEPGLGVTVRGLNVVVTAEDVSAPLAVIEMFVPEPSS